VPELQVTVVLPSTSGWLKGTIRRRGEGNWCKLFHLPFWKERYFAVPFAPSSHRRRVQTPTRFKDGVSGAANSSYGGLTACFGGIGP